MAKSATACVGTIDMISNWDLLSDEQQLALTAEALRHAVTQVAAHAETLATELESGAIADRGGAESLRLLAALVRLTAPGSGCAVGRA
jgi:hypothetical protein